MFYVLLLGLYGSTALLAGVLREGAAGSFRRRELLRGRDAAILRALWQGLAWPVWPHVHLLRLMVPRPVRGNERLW